ncbi:MAG: hypothetical protein K6C08_11850 [Oscillospiraceae bacterium]|nr:hypothetical protein [Oscillospiraceae bacterium]
MEIKILLAAAVFFAGWLWFYLLMRQFMFNFTVAFPLIRRMQSLDPELIAVGARRYTTISVLVCTVVSAVLIFAIVYFCPLYLIISFFVGAVLCFGMLVTKVRPENRAMFDSFCLGYYRFVADDELRTHIYNKDIKKINHRLRDMGLSGTFVPEFRKSED